MLLLFSVFLILAAALSLAACNRQPGGARGPDPISHCTRDDWADDVRAALNDLVDSYGCRSEGYDGSAYAVFDFDNTCAIFDIQEQLCIHQLLTMSFAIAPEELAGILATGIGMDENGAQDLNAARPCRSADGIGHSYADWIGDICDAYGRLYETYGPFTAAGLDESVQSVLREDPQWMEFATKMWAFCDLVFAVETAGVSCPWVTYWLTGMMEAEAYALTVESNLKYRDTPTELVTWVSPKELSSRVGVAECRWNSGLQVTENTRELWRVLRENGIQVWVCSASAVEPIRAAIDVFGLHDQCTGMLAMVSRTPDGKYINEYDYETGYGWLAGPDGTWIRDAVPLGAMTCGKDKVTAIANTLGVRYGHGPIAGFMDATGDFNFCTEFETLKLAVCFNRATGGVTEGGGLIAELAVYQRDSLAYDLKKANAAGDTLYLLQGRDENGLRTFRNSNATLRCGADEERLFATGENEARLRCMAERKMSTREVIDRFSIRTASDAPGNPLGFAYGFLSEYNGYHSHR